MNQARSETPGLFGSVIRALHRARFSILAVALAYVISVAVGILMVHTGNKFAVTYRDNLVSQAQSGSTLVALGQNNRLRAALLDFGGNLLGAISNTGAGLGVIFPFPIIVYRGWVGGIVSIDGAHVSRLADPRAATYYLVTLVLQLVPYTLAGGAGVNLGLAFLRPRGPYQGQKWLGIPKEVIWDVLRIYLLVVPLFLIASLWVFLVV